MCPKKSKNNKFPFSNINKNSFNQFDKAMNYLNNNHSTARRMLNAKEKLTNYLASSLGISPTTLLDRVRNTIDSSERGKN